MNPSDVASLSDALLVVKGSAGPSTPKRKTRRGPLEDSRVRVALRIDEPRHHRLRLAAAHMHKSAQSVLLAALDHYLDRIVPNALDEPCACLDQRGKPRSNVTPLRTP
ncbi:MAG TPA: hypothetical protein VLV50_13630 [Stellaceae bacterium]|nr:hypothetical protein [Stellaceae bacterium]